MKPVLILLAVASVSSFADKNCDWAVQVQKDGPGNLARIEAETDAIRNQNFADEGLIANSLDPQLRDAKQELALYDASIDTITRAKIGIRDALSFVQNSVLKDKGVTLALNGLKNQIQINPSRSLADQIRDAIAKMEVGSDIKDKLTQLANAVALVESSQADWQKSESQLLQDYLGGKTDIAGSLFNELNQLSESLQSSLDNLTSDRKSEGAVRVKLEGDIATVNARLDTNRKAVDAKVLEKANFQKYINNWSPDNYCPKWSPPDPIERCGSMCI